MDCPTCRRRMRIREGLGFLFGASLAWCALMLASWLTHRVFCAVLGTLKGLLS